MEIIIPEPSKEVLEKNGWKPWHIKPVYIKRINNCMVRVRPSYCESLYECWIPNEETLMPNDLIAIGEELKKLKENQHAHFNSKNK